MPWRADLGANLLAANEALVLFLPKQLDRLRAALDVHPITMADMPAELRDDWLLNDGQARVQALPRPGVKDGHAMRSWVKGALKAVPQSTGSAVYILKASDTITGAFEVAAYSALAAITLILALALRRVTDVLLVMTPLLVSSLLTALLLRLSGISLNFANIIALPLLLGVGVSFNIYFVMNWRSGVTRFLETATARAVVFFGAHHQHGVWLIGVIAAPGHCQHGRIVAHVPGLHGSHNAHLSSRAARPSATPPCFARRPLNIYRNRSGGLNRKKFLLLFSKRSAFSCQFTRPHPPGAAASIPAGQNGRYIHWEYAANNPGAQARPARNPPLPTPPSPPFPAKDQTLRRQR